MIAGATRRQFVAACVWLIVLGLLAACFAVIGGLFLGKTAFDRCYESPAPPGAVASEFPLWHAYSRELPVAGRVCVWEKPGGGTFETFEPDAETTTAGWVAIIALITGPAGLIVASRRRRVARPS